jgi:hypothetical protein
MAHKIKCYYRIKMKKIEKKIFIKLQLNFQLTFEHKNIRTS